MGHSHRSSSTRAPMTEKMVLEYISKHPEFLNEHPELWQTLTPPEQQHGNDVVDLQYHMLENLQKNLKDLQGSHEDLVLACRDNMSIQQQVHGAALAFVRADSLDEILGVLTVELPQWFDVDIVRLALESELANTQQPILPQSDASLALLPTGSIAQLFPRQAIVNLQDNAQHDAGDEIHMIFADCPSIIHSYALLRLQLARMRREAVVAFGVRRAEHFHPSQGTDLLAFLAHVLEQRLDQCLCQTEWHGVM